MTSYHVTGQAVSQHRARGGHAQPVLMVQLLTHQLLASLVPLKNEYNSKLSYPVMVVKLKIPIIIGDYLFYDPHH